jgi:hypothetical protein
LLCECGTELPAARFLATPQKGKKLKRRKKSAAADLSADFLRVYAAWYWRARKLIYYSAHKFVARRNF